MTTLITTLMLISFLSEPTIEVIEREYISSGDYVLIQAEVRNNEGAPVFCKYKYVGSKQEYSKPVPMSQDQDDDTVYWAFIDPPKKRNVIEGNLEYQVNMSVSGESYQSFGEFEILHNSELPLFNADQNDRFVELTRGLKQRQSQGKLSEEFKKLDKKRNKRYVIGAIGGVALAGFGLAASSSSDKNAREVENNQFEGTHAGEVEFNFSSESSSAVEHIRLLSNNAEQGAIKSEHTLPSKGRGNSGTIEKTFCVGIEDDGTEINPTTVILTVEVVSVKTDVQGVEADLEITNLLLTNLPTATLQFAGFNRTIEGNRAILTLDLTPPFFLARGTDAQELSCNNNKEFQVVISYKVTRSE